MFLKLQNFQNQAKHRPFKTSQTLLFKSLCEYETNRLLRISTPQPLLRHLFVGKWVDDAWTDCITKLTVTYRKQSLGVIALLVSNFKKKKKKKKYKQPNKTTVQETMLISQQMPVQPGPGSLVICTLITLSEGVNRGWKALERTEGLLKRQPC